jgi:hypothetical protein
MEDFGQSNDIQITDDEWLYVVKKMQDDEGVWQELNESFKYYVELAIENRKKGESNDNSE